MRSLRLALILASILPFTSAPAMTHEDRELKAAIETALVESTERHGAPPSSFSIEHSAEQRYTLGATLDLQQPSDDGLEVLAIEPGSAASRMGLRVGDHLKSLNGQRLRVGNSGATELLSALRSNRGHIVAVVVRNSEPLTLAGEADTISIPAYRLEVLPDLALATAGCGFISSGGHPRDMGQRLKIVAIDGKPVLSGPISRLKVAAGPHRLSVRPRANQVFNSNYAAMRTPTAGPPMLAGQPTLPRSFDLAAKGATSAPQPPAVTRLPLDQEIEVHIDVAANTHYQLALAYTADGKALVPVISRQTGRECTPGD